MEPNNGFQNTQFAFQWMRGVEVGIKLTNVNKTLDFYFKGIYSTDSRVTGAKVRDANTKIT